MKSKSFLIEHFDSEVVKNLADLLDSHERIFLADVILLLLDVPIFKQSFDSSTLEKVKSDLIQVMQKHGDSHKVMGKYVFNFEKLLMTALKTSEYFGTSRVSIPVFFVACIETSLNDDASNETQELLKASGITRNKIWKIKSIDGETSRKLDFTYKPLQLGENLIEKANSGYWKQCPLYGMESELQRLAMALNSEWESIILVGPPGVGKSVLVYGLAYHIATSNSKFIPDDMSDFTIVSISTNSIIAGTGDRGALEEVLEKLFVFFKKNPHVIPFFDEVHTLLDASNESTRAIANALKPALANGEFHCIGATTDVEYVRFISSDEPLNSRFTRITIPEPSHENVFQIMKGTLNNLISPKARKLQLKITDEALNEAIRITSIYQRNDYLPRKAIRLLQSVISKKTYILGKSIEPEELIIDAVDVATFFSTDRNIPHDSLTSDRKKYYCYLEKQLKSHVFGQDLIIDDVLKWLQMNEKGWTDNRRPRGRFLFTGPTGVGKSELAIRLSELIMNDRNAVITKNMAQYQEESSLNRFKGSDPGYKDSGEITTIYSQVYMRPFSIVVLNEIDKTHPILLNPLISILDGSAEDSRGRVVDFSQCIFVMTTSLTQLPGKNLADNSLKEHLLSLQGIWSQSFLDRIDRIFEFNALTDDILLKILDKMILSIKSRSRSLLPGELSNLETRKEIIRHACMNDKIKSARRLERTLNDWLLNHS